MNENEMYDKIENSSAENNPTIEETKTEECVCENNTPTTNCDTTNNIDNQCTISENCCENELTKTSQNSFNSNHIQEAKCPRCGFITSNNFCANCGFNLVQWKRNPQFNNQSNNTAHWVGYKKPLSGFKIFLIILASLGIIGLFISLISIVITTTNYSSSTTKDDIFIKENISSSSSEYKYNAGISVDEYKKLEKGMSYARVSKIIGGDGYLSDQGKNIYDQKFYTYSWLGEDKENAIVHITFVEDTLDSIVEYDLLS